MVHNNDALYDAVVAGAGGGAQHGWLVLSTPASYTPFATNIDILATAVDLQIPTIAGGASISQINLLQSITQSVLTARYPVPVAPATYVDIAKSIAAVYTELEKLLTNQPDVASYGVNWLVTDWYIDGTVGDDANSGVVIGAPLKTGAELLRRLGPYAMWPQSVTVHVLANGMIDALVLRGLMMVAGTHLDVIGTPTQMADAGALTLYQALDHTVPRATHISCVNIPDWTPYQWLRLRVTSGAYTTACAWVAKPNPDGLGVSVARVSRFAWISTTLTSSLQQTATPALGNTIVIESLPSISAITLDIDGPIDGSTGANYPRCQWSITSIDCPSLSIRSTAFSLYARSYVFGCKLSGCYYAAATPTSAVWSSQTSCLYDSVLSSGQAGSIYPACFHFAPLYGKNTTRLDLPGFFYGGSSYPLLQGVRLRIPSGTYNCDNMQIFDVLGAANAAFDLLNLAYTAVFGLSGNGNEGIAFRAQNSCNCKLVSPINLQGVVATVRLSSVPQINLSWTQFLQPSDYAQKGNTPAMVAGTTTVTVPWYDNATQQVTVSHAAFAGTPGILSVQQISTTQFTITSSSALDTSTVRWQISPLGRNIFVSTT